MESFVEVKYPLLQAELSIVVVRYVIEKAVVQINSDLFEF